MSRIWNLQIRVWQQIAHLAKKHPTHTLKQSKTAKFLPSYPFLIYGHHSHIKSHQRERWLISPWNKRQLNRMALIGLFEPFLSFSGVYLVSLSISFDIQVIIPSEPPKLPKTSTIEVEEQPESDEPLEWYLLGLRYLAVPTLLPVFVPSYLYLYLPNYICTYPYMYRPTYLYLHQSACIHDIYNTWTNLCSGVTPALSTCATQTSFYFWGKVSSKLIFS